MPEIVMSQLRSSSDLSSAEPTPPAAVSEEQMRALLRGFYAEDRKPTFFEQLLIRFADPFQKSKNGGFKPSPLWLSLGVFTALALSVFLYFSFGRL
jgi:hypothetical protein